MSNTKSINILCCAEVDDEITFRASEAGFCDYIIPSKMTREIFDSRFWGPEGNNREISYVALDGDRPIGLVLGGIRKFDNYQTMRCGMLGVAPEYRGSGLAGRLMEFHSDAAVENKCERMFLEVIQGNDRAISFYRKLGYVETCDIKYFNFFKRENHGTGLEDGLKLRDSSYKEVAFLREKLFDVHLHWQREMDYIKTLDFQYKVLDSNGIVAAILVYSDNLIPFLYVYPGYRKQGYGRYMLEHALTEMPDEGLMRFSFTNNSNLERFCLSNGGEREKISQHEMYLMP